MASAVVIFVVGLGGVFAGMGLLYLSIRITAAMIERWLAARNAGRTEA